MNLEADQLFSVPIFKTIYPNAESFQKLIVPIFKNIESNDKNPFDYCATGYTSYPNTTDILLYPECKDLLDFIGNNVVLAHEYLGLSNSITLRSSWFSINRKHSYHTKHNHLPWIWSGVYYVKANHKEDSNIIFHNKNLESNWPFGKTDSAADKHSMAAQSWAYPAETGILYIFPGFIDHEVGEQRTDNERITISFNFSSKDAVYARN